MGPFAPGFPVFEDKAEVRGVFLKNLRFEKLAGQGNHIPVLIVFFHFVVEPPIPRQALGDIADVVQGVAELPRPRDGFDDPPKRGKAIPIDPLAVRHAAIGELFQLPEGRRKIADPLLDDVGAFAIFPLPR